MPSAKSRAAKAATAARVAAYDAAASARETEIPVKATGTVGIGKLMHISGRATGFEDLKGKTTIACVSPMPFKPTLPSMLNLNTSPNMSRALAVGAVLVGSEQTVNPSDEENVQPVITRIASTTPSNRVEERSSRALSPILGNIENEKDVRAYEFQRQKVKRAGELVKRKVAKAAKTSGGYVFGGHSHNGRGASEGNVGDEGRRDRFGSNNMDIDIAEMLVEKPIASRIDRDKVDVPGNGQVEVSLSELVLRQKKPRKVKGVFVPWYVKESLLIIR